MIKYRLLVDRSDEVTMVCLACPDENFDSGKYAPINPFDTGGKELKTFHDAIDQDEIEQIWFEHLNLFHKDSK